MTQNATAPAGRTVVAQGLETVKSRRSALIAAIFLMATSAIGPGFITQTATFTTKLGAAFAGATGFAAVSLAIAPAIAPIARPDPATWSAATIERGRQLAALGACAVCHTAKDGVPYAGGFALETPFGTVMVAPAAIGRRETTTVYAVVPDVAARPARARAAGAEIFLPLEAQPYGGSSFSVRDPEGHLFTFGDYDPFT